MSGTNRERGHKTECGSGNAECGKIKVGVGMRNAELKELKLKYCSSRKTAPNFEHHCGEQNEF